LDEPFSAIDAKLRKSLQSRIKEIHKELGMTSVFVTHDQDESMTMSDHIYLMNDGMIEQSASPIELYSQPKTLFAAGFMGDYNILDGKEFSKIAGEDYYSNKVAFRPELILSSGEPFEICDESVRFKGVITDMTPQRNTIRYQAMVDEIKIKVDVLFDKNQFFNINELVHFKILKDHIIQYSE
jgi:putative spermidine/putrescine transport system ATP-binding protein